MQIRFLIIYIFLCLSFLSHSQEYNYQHYDLTSGLSGLTVYNIAQDKNSFLWFATETGVSRFDGINFKNFTTSDGLPDNEVLKLYVDSKNRVWMLPFTNSICYYKDGEIHSQKNDSILAKIKFMSNPIDIAEDDSGNIVIIGVTTMIVIDIKGIIRTYDKYDSNNLTNTALGRNTNGNVNILTTLNGKEESNLYELSLDKSNFSLYTLQALPPPVVVNMNTIIRQGKLFVYPSQKKIFITHANNLTKVLEMPDYFTGFSFVNDSLMTINCAEKVFLFNLTQGKIVTQFAMGSQVNCCFVDSEGSYWFATNGYGIYRLRAFAFKNYEFSFQNNKLPVYSISKNKNTITAGTSKSLIWKIDLATNKISNTKLRSYLGGRVTSLVYDSGRLVAGADGVHIISNDKVESVITKDLAIKSIFEYDNKLLVATGRMTYIISESQPLSIDTIWTRRATCAYKFDNLFYIGTINGLYVLDQEKKEIFIGKKEPLLSSRISQIARSGDTLWIATYGGGIVGYDKNKVFAHITEKDGLTSNMCRTINCNSHFITVGTDKGLNIISFNSNKYKVSSYTSRNGMTCDIINFVYSDHDTIYVGTPYGLTFFNPSEVDNYSIAVLNIDNIASRKYKWTSHDTLIHLSPDDNRLYTEFSCVSFKSQGNISYYYRLIGADDQWHTTKENKLDFPSLSSGDYKLELYAVNAFGKESNRITIEVTVEKYFYQQAWFILLLSLSLLSILWLFISKRIEKIRSNENEKLVTQKRLSELEQLAFRAQMNPHFIFNCLNSIQQYIFSKNAIDANRFITEFASLIRQTMDLSAQKFITIDEEIKFLTTYLKLEHTRFEKNFDYDILIDKAIDAENIYIPSLLLQPFLENSIRHGIRNLKDKKGKIFVIFSLEDHFIICRIEDNGIGMTAARALKNGEEHESKGISLIQKRIEVLNSENSRKISLRIENGFQNEPNTGTTVILQIPDNL